MSMPPSGVTGLMDEDALIEAEIAQELDQLDLDNDPLDDNYDNIYQDNEEDFQENDNIPPELDHYLQYLQQQTSKFEKELEECDEVLKHTDSSIRNSQALIPYEDVQLLEDAAREAGEDPEVFRRRILEEIEKERDEDLLDINVNEDIFLKAGVGSSDNGEGDEKALVLLDENQLEFHRMLKDKLSDIESIHKQREEKLRIELEEEKVLEDKLHKQEEENRLQKRLLVEQEVMALAKERLVQQEKLEQDEIERKIENEKEMRKYQVEIEHLTEEVDKERKHLEETLKHEEERQCQRREKAATKIQSVFRGHSVRKVYISILSEKIKERKVLLQEQKLKEAEMKIEQRRKEIEREKEAERQKIEEDEKEKKQKEEQKRLEAIKREEQMKKEEEMKEQKKREEEQKAEERKKQEQAKLEEERKRKEEERKEQMRREEERKREEEIKLKEERKKIEEEERKKREEERKKREEEERKNREEEERKQREEEIKNREDRRKAEQNKRKEEEQKRQEQIKFEEERNKEGLKIEEEIRTRKKETDLDQERENEECKRNEEKNVIKEEVHIRRERSKEEEDEKEQNGTTWKMKENLVMEGNDQVMPKEIQDKRKEENVQISTLNKEQERNWEKERSSQDLKKSTGVLSPGNGKKTNKVLNTSQAYRGELSDKDKRKESSATARGLSDSDNDDLMMSAAEQDSHRKGQSTVNAMMHGLTENLEKQRIDWIKQCVPWSKISNEPWKLKTNTLGKRAPRRPSSAKKLLPLEEHVVLAATHVQTLRQVTTVQLEDLPGCNVSTLGQCWGLESLSMKKCNLITVEGLHQCKKLKYLDLQDNYIEYLELKDLGNLVYLNLSHNKLSSVHGVDGCINLRWFDLSYNRVTRIGGMHTLRRLHTLELSQNQLISTQGLSDTPTLQSLNLSNNHLQGCEDITNLCLLQRLDVSSNNLLTLPDLDNQVLLQELCVQDNSISDLRPLKQAWLPLLQTLNIGQNSIEDLVTLNQFQILKTVDVSNNQIVDIDMVLNSLADCMYLEVVCVDGNPITEDTSMILSKFRENFSRLLSVDDSVLRDSPDSLMKPKNSFETMCFTQVQRYQEINREFKEELKSLTDVSQPNLDSFCKTFFTYCDKTFNVSVDFRYAHEYGEIAMVMPTAPTTPKTGNRPRSARTKPLKEEQYLSPKDLFEKAVQSGKSAGSDHKVVQGSNAAITANVVGRILNTDTESEAFQLLRERSAIKIQAAWRGYSLRRDIEMYNQTRMQEQTALDIDPRIIEELHQAATKIQSVWRGYNLRCKLERALEFAKFDDEDEFEFDEVDLGEFNFDEDMLNDWKPPTTPQIPSSHPVLGKPPSGKPNNLPPLDKVPGLNLTDGPYPPSQPRKAWRGSESPLSDVLTPHNRPPRPPSSLASGPLSAIDSHRSGLSKKEEKLSEEWGFKDNQTAFLMMQRAKKMKYNSERRKKLSKLDPKQRLALFRKLEETTNVRTVKPPSRKTLPRKEYFQARQQEIVRQEAEKRVEISNRKNRTFEWIHTQVGDYETTDSRIIQHGRSMYGSEGNLPKFDSEVISGRPARHGGSPVSMDLQSMDSVSMAGEFSKPRRLSTGSNGSTLLPPIKTGSAPTNRTKEKMSWRNPVERSVGWGGGKKRQK